MCMYVDLVICQVLLPSHHVVWSDDLHFLERSTFLHVVQCGGHTPNESSGQFSKVHLVLVGSSTRPPGRDSEWSN